MDGYNIQIFKINLSVDRFINLDQKRQPFIGLFYLKEITLKYFCQRVRIQRGENVGVGDDKELFFEEQEGLPGDPGRAVRLQAPLEDLDHVGGALIANIRRH